METKNAAAITAPKRRKKSVLGTLLWKNAKLKISKPFSSLFELLLPMLLVIGFSQLKGETDIFTVETGWSRETESCPYGFTPGSFNKSCTFPYSRFLETVPTFDVASRTRLNGNLPDHPYAKLLVAHDNTESGMAFMDSFLTWATSEEASSTEYMSTFNESHLVFGSGTEDEVQNYLKSPTYGKPFSTDKPEVAGVLVFQNMNVQEFNYEYKIRLNSTSNDLFMSFRTRHSQTNGVQRSMSTGLLRRATTSGFMTMQLLVDQFIIGQGSYDSDFMPFFVQTLPYPITEYQVDEFFGFVTQVFGLFYILCYLWPVAQLMSALISEKESRMREMMRMMGVSDNQLFGSWFITYGVTFFILSIVLTAVSATMFPSTANGGFPWLIFVLFYLFSLCTLSFCYVFSAFFWKARIGSIIGVTLYFAGFYAYYQTNSFDEGKPLEYLLIPQVSFALCIQGLSQLEFKGLAMTLDSIQEPVEGFVIANGFAFLLFDFILYTVVGWYLNQVVPQEFGKPQPFYFPLLPSYWCAAGVSENIHDDESEGSQSDESNPGTSLEALQPVGPSLQSQIKSGRCVQIKGLRRVFDTPAGEKVAVKKLSLDMYEGQVLALLGHNGAGKTTTLSILGGMLVPTSGTAIIRGLDIRNNMREIRQDLGFCPQHDVLYPDLTVKDHLEFYGSVKGLRGNELKEAVSEKIKEVGLTEKIKTRTKALSGGQKRKLSVAISLIGNSKVVFLDEPTSGMDPFSRRSTWELIQNNRDGRVIVLTTHFMDEADILGDRIAIMADGELRCVGDSLFLKNRYGEGYTLTLVKKGASHEGGQTKVVDSTPAINTVMSAVEGARLVTNVGAEIAFQLPVSQTTKFADLFRTLDDNLESLGIEQYGISVTTMDEVFLKVAAGEEGAAIEGKKQINQADDESSKAEVVHNEDIGLDNLGSIALFFLHFRTLYIKRVRFAKRDIKSFVCIAVLPILLITFGLIVLTITPIGTSQPSLQFGYNALNTDFLGTDFLMPFVALDEPSSSHPSLLTKPQPSQVVFEQQEVFGDRITAIDATKDAAMLGLKDPSEPQEVFGRQYADGIPTPEECLRAECRNPATSIGAGILTLGQTLLETKDDPRQNGTSSYLSGVVQRLPLRRKRCNMIDLGGLADFSFESIQQECKDGQDLCMYAELSVDLSEVEIDGVIGDVLATVDKIDLCVPAGCIGDSLQLFSNANTSALAGLAAGTLPINVDDLLESLTVFVCDGDACNENRIQSAFDILKSSACRDPTADQATDKDELCVIPGLKQVDIDKNFVDYDVKQDTNTCALDTSRRLDVSLPRRQLLNATECTNSTENLATCSQDCLAVTVGSECTEQENCEWSGTRCTLSCELFTQESDCGRDTLFGQAAGTDCEWFPESGVCQMRKRMSYVLMANSTFRYGGETGMNKMNTALLRAQLLKGGNTEGARKANITVNSHPFPLTSNIDQLIDGFKAFTTAIFIVVGFAFVPAAVMGYVVLEKQTCKHQQTVSGVGPLAYWSSMYAFDLTTYLFPLIATVILLAAFEVESFTNVEVLGCIVLLLLSYGLAVFPFTYVLSHLFSKHTTAQNMALLINLLTGLVLMITSFVLDQLETTQDVNVSLKYIYRIFPGFCLGDSIQQLALQSIIAAFVNQASNGAVQSFSPYDLDITGTNFIYLLVSCVIWSTLAVGIDIVKSYPALWAKIVRDRTNNTRTRPEVEDEVEGTHKDSDVLNEEERVKLQSRASYDSESANKSDIVKMIGLRKVYRGGKVAVKGVTLGIPAGQCFGYLGINGAGKTTTIKCLTGDISPTSGSAFLDGLDIQVYPSQVRHLVGYCPQFDALLDLLTVREHLEMYARIKAVPNEQLEDVIQAKMKELTLTEFENKVARTLSGGNKRKLSVAIAMIGNPKVMFLDEPSTGMDPVSRRKMWDVISRMSSDTRQTAVILTSHSMEECEALCDRVGIMVGGELQCLGPIQHLKNKFGSGLMVEVKIRTASVEVIDDLCDKYGLPSEMTMEDIANFVGKVTPAEVGQERFSMIEEKRDEAWVVWKTLSVDGRISSTSFVSWWILQDNYTELLSFLNSNFMNSVLLENHEYHFRFRLPKDSLAKFGLGDIFDLFESNKERLRLDEYSVSQTSLEQIFNQFAANQDEERGVARGLAIVQN